MTDAQLTVELKDARKEVDQKRAALNRATEALKNANTVFVSLRSEQVSRSVATGDGAAVLKAAVDGGLPYGSVYKDVQAAVNAQMASLLPERSFHDTNRFQGEGGFYLTPELTPPASVDAAAWAAGLMSLMSSWSQVYSFPPVVMFSVMSNDLSEHGSVGLRLDWPEGTATVVIMVYGRESVLFTGTLEDALAYLSAEHHYGRPYPEDEVF